MEFYKGCFGHNPQFPFLEYLDKQARPNQYQNSGLESLSEEQLIDRLRDLQAKHAQLQKQNTDLKTILSQPYQPPPKAESPLIDASNSPPVKYQPQSPSEQPQPSERQYKKRRTAAMLNKNIGCPYPSCDRHYASTLALDLHIKLKHNGGTKKERKQILKAVIDAELQGTPMPTISVNLPPDYIQEKKKILLSCEDFLKLGLVLPDHH